MQAAAPCVSHGFTCHNISYHLTPYGICGLPATCATPLLPTYTPHYLAPARTTRARAPHPTPCPHTCNSTAFSHVCLLLLLSPSSLCCFSGGHGTDGCMDGCLDPVCHHHYTPTPHPYLPRTFTWALARWQALPSDNWPPHLVPCSPCRGVDWHLCLLTLPCHANGGLHARMAPLFDSYAAHTAAVLPAPLLPPPPLPAFVPFSHTVLVAFIPLLPFVACGLVRRVQHCCG